MGKKKEEKEEPGGFERKDEGALADHLKQCQKLASGKDFNKGYLFTILVKNPSNYDKSEQYWIDTLATMSPYELNLDKLCGLSASLMSISARLR